MTDIGPKALREMCERATSPIHRKGVTNLELHAIAEALLDRLSGEAVTRERINQILRQHIRIEDDSEEWESPQPRTAGIDKAADAILSLLPAGMDRNAVVEECIGRTEQACRYVAKHNETATTAEERKSDYYEGFFAACDVCEKAIREHVERHLKSPT